MPSENEDDDLEALRKAALATLKQKVQPIEKVISSGVSSRCTNSPPWSDVPASMDFPLFADPIPEANQFTLPYEARTSSSQHMKPWFPQNHNGAQSFRFDFGAEKNTRRRFSHQSFGGRAGPIYDRGNRRMRRGFLPHQRDVKLKENPSGSFMGHPKNPQSCGPASSNLGTNLIVIQPQTSGDGKVSSTHHQKLSADSRATNSSKSTNEMTVQEKSKLPHDKYLTLPSGGGSVKSPEDSRSEIKAKDKFSRYDKSDSEEDDLSDIDDIALEIDRVLADDDDDDVEEEEAIPDVKETKMVEQTIDEGQSVPELVLSENKAEEIDDLEASLSADDSNSESLDLDALADDEPSTGDFEDLDSLVDKEPDSDLNIDKDVVTDERRKDSVHCIEGDGGKLDVFHSNHLVSLDKADCWDKNEENSVGRVGGDNSDLSRVKDKPLVVSPSRHNLSPGHKSSVSPRRQGYHHKSSPYRRRSRSPLYTECQTLRRSTSPKRYFSRSPHRSLARRSVSPHRSLARRSVSPHRSLARRSVSPHKSLTRRSVSPHEPVARRSVSPHRSLARRSVSPHESVVRRSVSPHKSVARRSVSPHRKRFPPKVGYRFTSPVRNSPVDSGRVNSSRSFSPFSKRDRIRSDRYDSVRDRNYINRLDRDESKRSFGNHRERSRPQQEGERPGRPQTSTIKEKSIERDSDTKSDTSHPRASSASKKVTSSKEEISLQEQEVANIDLEKLTPEERAKIEARRKKFDRTNEVKVTDTSKTISLKSVKSRDKKLKKKSEKEENTVFNSKKQLAGISLKKLRKKHESKKVKEEEESPKLEQVADLEDDSDESDQGRSWKKESAGVSQKTSIRSLSSFEPVRKDRSSRKRLDEYKERHFHRQKVRPEQLRNERASDEDIEGVKSTRLSSSVVPSKPPDKLRIQVQIAPKESKKKLKVFPDYSKIYSVPAKRKHETVEDSQALDEELSAKKMKRKKEKKKKHSKGSTDCSDTALLDSKNVLDPAKSPAKPSILERLGKKVNLKSSEKKEKKKSKKNLSADEGTKDLDVHIRKMKAKNEEIVRRQREIQLDKEKYG